VASTRFAPKRKSSTSCIKMTGTKRRPRNWLSGSPLVKELVLGNSDMAPSQDQTRLTEWMLIATPFVLPVDFGTSALASHDGSLRHAAVGQATQHHRAAAHLR